MNVQKAESDGLGVSVRIAQTKGCMSAVSRHKPEMPSVWHIGRRHIAYFSSMCKLSIVGTLETSFSETPSSRRILALLSDQICSWAAMSCSTSDCSLGCFWTRGVDSSKSFMTSLMAMASSGLARMYVLAKSFSMRLTTLICSSRARMACIACVG